MPREFMVGTLDDTPLLIVRLDGLTYFIDLSTRMVYEEKPGLPELTDSATIKSVLAAADEMNP